jgi:hypothetical protein
MPRKTIVVEQIKDDVNRILATYIERDTDSEFLMGYRQLLENILHTTGNYRGYNFLDKSQVPAGERAGCHFDLLSSPDRFEMQYGSKVDRAFQDTDSNRIRYY